MTQIRCYTSNEVKFISALQCCKVKYDLAAFYIKEDAYVFCEYSLFPSDEN